MASPISDPWAHVNEARAWTNQSARIVWDKFSSTGAGRWYSALSPKMKIGVGITAAALALSGTRLLWRTIQPDMQSPPPAYQGAYGKIEGMRHSRYSLRSLFSDFGSGMRHPQAVRRSIMPRRHNVSHRAYTGLVQEMTR
jgi:hypothetical protein